MTDPDILQAEPDTEPEFDQYQAAAELRLAIKGDADSWFSMSKDTFVAIGRNDGAATVLGTDTGWHVLQHTNGRIHPTTFTSVEDAVKAAQAVGA